MYSIGTFSVPIISIHAPTRGATSNITSLKNGVIISIHAPTRGATTIILVLFTIIVFQSTLLQEERHPTRTHHANPNLISIHAPTRGATLSV